MLEFLDALARHSFLQNALVTGLLVSVATGVIGTYVVVRRITYIAGGISHSVLGGIGAGVYLSKVHGWQVTPFEGAVAAALLSALIIGWVSLRAKQREDTVIGALWAVGMAAGVLFLSQTPGYAVDIMSYLFGSILMVTRETMWVIVGLDVLVVGVGILFYRQFVAICFDEEFARLRGVHVELFYLILLCMTALTVVLLTTVVGIVMVIALLTLPVAVAGYFSKSLWQMMLIAAGLSMVFTSSGLALSYGPNLPSGATTIMLAAAAYLAVVVWKGLPRAKPKANGGNGRARRPA